MLKNPFRYAPKTYPPKERPDQNLSLEEEKKLWKNKIIPKHLEDIFYEALAQYPELEGTHLIVIETKLYGIQHTLRSYPALLSLLSKRSDRVYPIVINTNKNIPNNFHIFKREEQLGMLAHELAHTVDYETRTSLELLGLSYSLIVSKKFVRQLEQATDETTVLRGYGDGLLAYRERLLEIAPPDLGNFVESIYLYPKKDARNGAPRPQNGKTISGLWYGIVSATSAIPAISQMMYLVWIRKMHKKPNWYRK